MRSRGVLKLRRGDTLIEVVFALAILATLLTVLTTSAISSWRTSRLAGERTQASAYIQEQVEALRAYRAGKTWAAFTTSIPPAISFSMQPQLSDTWGVTSGSYTQRFFTLAITDNGVQSLAGSPGTVRRFTVTATWRNFGGAGQNKSDQIVEVGENQ